jgi:hypothetical protein
VAKIDETKAFLEMEKNRPEDIRAKIDQILNITIPFNEEQIGQLSENVKPKKRCLKYVEYFQIRQKVVEAKDTDKILEETKGNKSTALKLQKNAEMASKRASAIHSWNFWEIFEEFPQFL